MKNSLNPLNRYHDDMSNTIETGLRVNTEERTAYDGHAGAVLHNFMLELRKYRNPSHEVVIGIERAIKINKCCGELMQLLKAALAFIVEYDTRVATLNKLPKLPNLTQNNEFISCITRIEKILNRYNNVVSEIIHAFIDRIGMCEMRTLRSEYSEVMLNLRQLQTSNEASVAMACVMLAPELDKLGGYLQKY